MKTRLGAFAIAGLLAACSGQGTDTKSDGWQARSKSPAGPQTAGADGLASLARDKARTLGNAPDKGALFTYADKKAVKQQGAYTLHPVRLSEEHAIRGVATGLMTVPAPDGSEIKIRFERHEEHPDGNWSWIGRVVGGKAGQEAIFTFGEEAVFGSIPQAIGPALRLTTKGGVAYVMQADAQRLKRGFRTDGDAKVRVGMVADADDSDNALVSVALAKARTMGKADVSAKAFTAANTIDLAIGYSTGFVTANGSVAIAGTRMNNLVTVANQALLNSNVNARIRLVASLQVNYADNTDNELALEQLTGHDGNAPFTPPASLLPLRTLREQFGADLVTLIRDFTPQNNGCGIAWLQGANGSDITAADDAPFGYSVVSDGDYNQNGNTFFCEDITLVHELAHNMGSQHDVGNADGISGRYPYSYGYKTLANGNFFTVMAYGDDNQQLYRVFSNPYITICGGYACGFLNNAENARSLNQTMPVVATFRGTVVPFLGAARNDIDGDGKSDLLWHHPNGNLATWILNGVAVTRESLQMAGGGFVPIATGDFNGDGKADIIWNRAQGDMQMWLGNGTTFTGQFFRQYPAGWNLVGAADMNGDGKSDLLWHQPSSGRLAFWVLNGATVSSEGLQLAGGGFVPIALGDFNGDNFVDIIWNRPQNDMQLWTGNGSSFSGQFLRTYPVGWNLVAAGDANGDGKADLLWHNPNNGNLATWIMNGPAVTQDRLQNAGGGFAPIATGDYNGDGLVDIIWNRPQADMQMWTSNGNSFGGQFFRTYPAGWNAVQGLGK